MMHYKFGEIDYFESSDFHDKSLLKSLNNNVKILTECFIKRRLFKEVLEAYKNKNNLEGLYCPELDL